MAKNAYGAQKFLDEQQFATPPVIGPFTVGTLPSAADGALAVVTDDPASPVYVRKSGAWVPASSGGGGSDFAAGYFGDGSNGDLTVTGTTTLDVNKASHFFNNLTIDPGAVLYTSGLRVCVKGTLTINGMVSWGKRAPDSGNADGANAVGSVRGLGGTAATDGSFGGQSGTAGAAGRTGTSGAGASGVFPTTVNGEGGIGGACGSGGAGALPGGAATNPTAITHRPWRILSDSIGATSGVGGVGGASGGGSGVSDAGGGGGGGGAGGGPIAIWANNIVIGAAGHINSNGGNGGNGGNGVNPATCGGGAGGGGGGGGFIYLVYKSITIAVGGQITVDGGSGGAGGSGLNPGTSGGNGSPGHICRINLTTGAFE